MINGATEVFGVLHYPVLSSFVCPFSGRRLVFSVSPFLLK